jgi:lysine-N-methylase
MTVPETFDFYPETRFECRCCDAGCCAAMEIPVAPEEREALRRLVIPEAPPFDECFRPGRDGGFILAKDADSHNCVYADGFRCRIHATCGYAAKPLGCRVFPLHIQHWRDGHISAEYRFFCPGVGGEAGRKLGEMTSQLRSFDRELSARRSADDAIFSKSNPLPLEKVRMIHAAFRRILHLETLPLPLRLYGAARALDFHGRKSMRADLAAADGRFAEAAENFVFKARPILERELAAGALNVHDRVQFRSLAAAYCREDDPRRRHGLTLRAATAWRQFRFVTGGGRLSALNPAAPGISGAQLLSTGSGARPEIAPEAAALFFRFFYGKLDSMHFCGRQAHHFDYETGLRHLLLAAPVVFALAAGFARTAGRNRIESSDLLPAVRRVDATFARSPLFRLAAARHWIAQLSRPGVYAGLLGATLPSEI